VNIDELAQSVSNDLGMAVLHVRLTSAIPAALQAYLFLSPNLVVGMHGGAWGSATAMSVGQAAVEIVPGVANAKHIVTPGGALYEASACPACKRARSNSGIANVADVIEKARTMLERIS
jgi:hypothetical protein